MTRNTLGLETSPYLLQHKDNPVHWLPWGEAAFQRAQAEDKPILLSVGYAACHWCHVMAHESFEDEATATLMNQHFVNVKVDREERPEVDKIYMDALHALGEQGGWPLTMFLTPQGEPFWGGTYFPKDSRYGRPSFRHVLSEIARIWREERQRVEANSRAIGAALKPDPSAGSGTSLSRALLEEAARTLTRAIDPTAGGLKGAPKFPQVAIFDFLRRMGLHLHDATILGSITVTLNNICQGGIYDHLGGGFARYSVDARWLVPHFEKMLYDNAQLLTLLARHWQATRLDLYRERAEETVDWLLAEMRAPDGGFASSYDADSEGEEGRFYVWTESEVDVVLPDAERELFKRVYDVTPGGNWEGHTILNRLSSMAPLAPENEVLLASSRARLRKHRADRVRPGFDDKVLADWNGLAISALAEAGLIFGRPAWIDVAAQTFDEVLTLLWDGEVLHHSYRAAGVRNLATADGYANLTAAALQLLEATGNGTYGARARALVQALERDHWDGEHGGFHFSSRRARNLILRQRYAHDDATPNANATMLANYVRLALLTGDERHRRQAQAIHDAFAGHVAGNPFAHASFLSAFDDLTGLVQVVLTGPSNDSRTMELRRAILDQPFPSRLLLQVEDPARLRAGHPAAGKRTADGRPALYLCRGEACSLPVTQASAIAEALRILDGSPRMTEEL
jgi:uncharacterized protein YyaL (SSP411 family)